MWSIPQMKGHERGIVSKGPPSWIWLSLRCYGNLTAILDEKFRQKFQICCHSNVAVAQCKVCAHWVWPTGNGLSFEPSVSFLALADWRQNHFEIWVPNSLMLLTFPAISGCHGNQIPQKCLFCNMRPIGIQIICENWALEDFLKNLHFSPVLGQQSPITIARACLPSITLNKTKSELVKFSESNFFFLKLVFGC